MAQNSPHGMDGFDDMARWIPCVWQLCLGLFFSIHSKKTAVFPRYSEMNLHAHTHKQAGTAAQTVKQNRCALWAVAVHAVCVCVCACTGMHAPESTLWSPASPQIGMHTRTHTHKQAVISVHAQLCKHVCNFGLVHVCACVCVGMRVCMHACTLLCCLVL